MFGRSPSGYQDVSPTGMSSSSSHGTLSGGGSFQNYGEEDSNDWVWSKASSASSANAASPNGRSESTKSTARASSSKKSAKSNEASGDLLIDFGDNKSKKGSAPKARTAEEEAWDMLNI